MIKIENLHKFYGAGESKNEVLKGVSLEIKDGDFVVILGTSGSGKSTLLYNISGMDKTTSGEIIFDGEKISEFDDKKMSQLRLQKMGFIFQQMHMLKKLCIIDNIVFSGGM